MHGVVAGREGGEERGVARIGSEAKGTDLREGGGERGAAAPVVVARPLSLAREQRELRIGDGIGDTEAAKGGPIARMSTVRAVEPPITKPAVTPVPRCFSTETLMRRGVVAVNAAAGVAS